MAYTDEELIQHAREALKHAYIPYSHYGVGACILSTDGRIFTGCNVGPCNNLKMPYHNHSH